MNNEESPIPYILNVELYFKVYIVWNPCKNRYAKPMFI